MFLVKKPLSQRRIQEEIIKDNIIYNLYLKRKPQHQWVTPGYIDRWQKMTFIVAKRIMREVGLKAVERRRFKVELLKL